MTPAELEVVDGLRRSILQMISRGIPAAYPRWGYVMVHDFKAALKKADEAARARNVTLEQMRACHNKLAGFYDQPAIDPSPPQPDWPSLPIEGMKD